MMNWLRNIEKNIQLIEFNNYEKDKINRIGFI